MDLSSPQWRKSSFSGPDEGCVEVAYWHKSSFSGPEVNCVEVALGPEVVGVRDTKNRTGGRLVVPEGAWRSLLTSVGVADL